MAKMLTFYFQIICLLSLKMEKKRKKDGQLQRNKAPAVPLLTIRSKRLHFLQLEGENHAIVTGRGDKFNTYKFLISVTEIPEHHHSY